MENFPYPDKPILDYQPIEPGKDRNSGKRKGLFGCLTLFLIVCALIGGFAYHSYKKVLGIILEDTPQVWPSIGLSKPEINRAEEKLRTIIKVHEEGGPPVSCSFSDEELNTLFARSDEFKDRVFVTFIKDEVSVEFSVPYKKRFLNGRLEGKIEAARGVIHLSLRAVQLGNYVFSQKILPQTAELVEEEINKSRKVKEYLRTVQTLKITNGMIFLKLKPKNLEG